MSLEINPNIPVIMIKENEFKGQVQRTDCQTVGKGLSISYLYKNMLIIYKDGKMEIKE